MSRPLKLSAEVLLVALISATAVTLRVVHLKAVAADPYYDSAVRAMGISWHDFFFGALEPGATVSLDKPPLDLWPAVLSTKIFGLGAVAMRAPEALAGALAVPLLYLALRAPFGARAALASAAALAVLPIEVITARSDTTDAIMMALLTLALCLVVRAVRSGRAGWLIGAAAVLGIAFNVKLAESWLALPPLALIAWLGLRADPRLGRRAASLRLLGAGTAYVAVALSWLAITLLVPDTRARTRSARRTGARGMRRSSSTGSTACAEASSSKAPPRASTAPGAIRRRHRPSVIASRSRRPQRHAC